MKLIHINTWPECMKCPIGKYIQNIPDYVEKINARTDFNRAYSLGMRQIPTWMITDDDYNVLAVSLEVEIDKALEWYRAYK